MLSLRTEAGLSEAWKCISAHAGDTKLAHRIAEVCPSVRLLGNGPFGWVELKQLIEPLGMQAVKWAIDRRGGAAVLVGDHGWTESELVEIVLAARGSRLRLTTQQDLVYELLLLIAPAANCPELRAERDALRAEHAALRWVSRQFGWETVVNRPVPIDTVAPPKPIPISAWQHARRSGWATVPSWVNGAVPLEGVLQASGYKVGWSGLGTEDRRRALRTVIEEELPRGFQASYSEQWGTPRSTARLWKTAETLAALARNAKNRDANMSRAIEHWEADLAWLRVEYSDVARGIYWPST